MKSKNTHFHCTLVHECPVVSLFLCGMHLYQTREFQFHICEIVTSVIFCISPVNTRSFRECCLKKNNNLMCNIDQDHSFSLLKGKMGTLSSWPKETTMQWMTEDCTSRANTGWRKKTWWDEQEGEQGELYYSGQPEEQIHQDNRNVN